MRRILSISFLAVVLTVGVGCGGGDKGKTADAPAPGAFANVPPEHIDRIVTAFNRGMGLMDRYQPAEAAEAFDEVVALAPDWTTGRLNLGIALLNTQGDEQVARAETELKTVLAEDPDNPTAHYALGMLYRHLSRLDEARAQFERVLEIDPADPDAHYQIGTLILEDDPAGARAHFEETLRVIPHHESACYRLQGLLRKAGEVEQARELLLRFRNLKASGAGVLSGMKYGEMGRYAYVLRAFDDPAPESSVAPAYTDVATDVGLTLAAAGNPGWPGASSAVSFGPGVAANDVDNDGDLDFYVPGIGPEGRGALYLNAGGAFTVAGHSGLDGRGAIGAYCGDYDGDGLADLYLTCDGTNRLYRNGGGGRFSDVTAASGVGGRGELSVGAAWADADHDGDLDLYVANFAGATGGAARASGAPNNLWRNNGDGTFTDVAADAGIDGGTVATMSVCFFDADEDRDLDLYLVNNGAPNRLFLNDRIGRYTEATSWSPGLDDDGPGLGALLGDVDGNGREDLLILKGAQPPRLFLQAERGRFVEDSDFAREAGRIGGAVGALFGDLDLDGDLDLVLLSAGSGESAGHRILMNAGAGVLEAAVSLGPMHGPPVARGALAQDFDGDGCLELLIARAGGPPQLWRAPAPAGHHWLEVVPLANADEAVGSVGSTAVGLLVEIKTGRRLQAASVTSSAGYLGSPPPVAHFGLGAHGKVDYARLSWPDAVLQGELEVAVDQSWRIAKASRKPSSCPVLFSWDGEQFAFVTDFLGVGGVGFFVGPQDYAPPDPTEDVRIPPALIKPENEVYRLRVTEPLEEVSYLDQMHLVAYDHPAGWEVYPDERFAGAPPFPTGRPLAVAKKIFPVAATDDQAEDMRDRILEVDRRYVEPPQDKRFIGYAKDHWLELDFGEQFADVHPDARIVLYLHGWIEYTYSHVNYAAYQAGLTLESPRIEVPDGNGEWRVAMADAGFPAGLPRMMTVDISALPIREDGRLRIRTNMEVFWDQVFAGVAMDETRIRVHQLRPSVAQLRVLGYPREYSPDGANPTLYDYHRVDQGLAFKNLTGDYTRLGDVRPLLRDVDDQFVVMGRGEEIALEFDASALPGLAPGWSRTIVLHADGYCKDMDLYTAFPDHVEPLPYHGMDNYPPATPPVNAESLAQYQRTWNTRRIEGQ